jgi:hypothetical protein
MKFMTKKEYHEMPRREVREEYLDKVKKVYSREGIFSGIKYEIDSIYHSLATAIKNFIEDTQNPPVDHSGKPHGFNTYERWKREHAEMKMEHRRQQNRKHILRGPKNGLEDTLTLVTLLSFIGATFFISSNITGNVLATNQLEIGSLFGIGLFLITILLGLFLLRKKKLSQ